MAHAVHDLSAVRSVLVVLGISDVGVVRNYMESITNNGGGAVQDANIMDYFTYVVDFSNHADAVNVVRMDHHAIAGQPANVFLYDQDKATVYSGPQIVSIQGEVVDISTVDPGAPTTVIVTPILGHPNLTANEIRVVMENLGCRVRRVSPQNPVCIAIVEFERSEDAMRAVNAGRVTIRDSEPRQVEQILPNGEKVKSTRLVQALAVRVFLLLPLPQDAA